LTDRDFSDGLSPNKTRQQPFRGELLHKEPSGPMLIVSQNGEYNLNRVRLASLSLPGASYVVQRTADPGK
jgi:hypothetical protein